MLVSRCAHPRFSSSAIRRSEPLFLTSNPAAGLDWPVRLLVYQDEKGDVWVLYTDFTWIAHRHGIMDRDEAFAKASDVIASITSTIK
jgi:uncharacterized protein (DUF302 family)